MSKIILLLTAAVAAVTVAAAPAKLPDATPLITEGPIVVDAADFEGNMLRIPEDRRTEVRLSYDRVATIVDNIFIARTLAARAREAGLDRDPAVQKRLQQVQEGVLADLYVQKVEKEIDAGNLDQRVRELYKADQAKFVTPEAVHVQQILVNLNGRTREMAQERAHKVLTEIKGGADFLSVAARYSDDPDKKKNGGDLGYNAPGSFVEPVRKAVAAMKAKGEIAGPVESEFGFHILRLVDRKPSVPIKYEAVADRILEAEKQRLRKERVEALISKVRSSPSVVVHRANVEKLVVPIDPEMIKRATEEAKAAAGN
ncbi:MAG TPA: peptidylprolyl isomerase [Usitatibacter sp.]|nr:peptidylprolyl isomerase [Usitatibacter sp.]